MPYQVNCRLPKAYFATSGLQCTEPSSCRTVSDLADWMEVAIPEGLTVFDFPPSPGGASRTSNMLEWVNQDPTQNSGRPNFTQSILIPNHLVTRKAQTKSAA